MEKRDHNPGAEAEERELGNVAEVLEEFIAKIAWGMRHPDVCLFLGACLEPPNLAIVTELCENGPRPCPGPCLRSSSIYC